MDAPRHGGNHVDVTKPDVHCVLPGFNEGVLTGNAKIRYSSEALQLVQNMPKLVRIFAWREL